MSISETDLQQAISANDLFSGVAADDLRKLQSCCVPASIKAGELLFSEDDAATTLYIVTRGSAEVQIGVAQEQCIAIHRVLPGSIVGWSAVIPPHVYTASCVALAPTEVLALNGPELRRMCEANPSVGYPVMRAIAQVMQQRMSETRTRLSNLVHWLRTPVTHHNPGPEI